MPPKKEKSKNDDLSVLKRKRGVIKRRVTLFNTFLQSVDDDTNKNEIKQRLKIIEGSFYEFDEIQFQIESIEPEQNDERKHFEDFYFEVITKANDFIDAGSSSQITNNANLNVTQSHVKLPCLNLQNFSGAYDKWSQFIETFDVLILNNTNLTVTQKFYYLQSTLKGDAAQVIQSLPITESNYPIARDLLKNRFENKRKTVNSHIKEMVEIPNILKESYLPLQRLLDNILKNTRSLKKLGQPTDEWDTLLIFLISSKLDATTKREWEMSQKPQTLPTFNEFTNFLANKCQILETLENKGSDVNKNKSYSKKQINSACAYATTTQKPECLMCKGSHFLHSCYKFLKLPVKQRKEQVIKFKACNNCLKVGHTEKECKYSKCRVCNQTHSTLLHTDNNCQLTNSTITKRQK